MNRTELTVMLMSLVRNEINPFADMSRFPGYGLSDVMDCAEQCAIQGWLIYRKPTMLDEEPEIIGGLTDTGIDWLNRQTRGS